MATVTVDMKFCEKKIEITVTPREDGDLDLVIDTDCDNVRSYYEKLGRILTADDVTDNEHSKVLDKQTCAPLTMTCMAPVGVINAAWLELGLLSKSRANAVGENVMMFRPE
ncbi:MAG: hypothetical protein GX137_06300 [Thermoplasmatales archaeon]|jgi:hypothetical protein|nr:hypothetical protein [Thermoplasmatales archaeon]